VRVIPGAPWRVVIVSQLPKFAQGYAELIRALGHEPVAHLAARFPPRFDHPRTREFLGRQLIESPQDLDLVYPGGPERIASVLRFYEPDLLICTAFPWRFPPDALAVPTIACVNGHPSLLPKYRGPTPFGWAIRNGETEIGMSYHRMEETFDSGAILAQKTVPLAEDETLETLWPKLGEAAAEILPHVFERLAAGEEGEPQGEGDYQSLFEEEYAILDTSKPAEEVHRQVRAWRVTPFGLAGRGPILDRDGRRVRVAKSSLTEVEGAERLECADGPIWILETEPPDEH
jgi:methionyl-tRNA formyltransferase